MNIEASSQSIKTNPNQPNSQSELELLKAETVSLKNQIEILKYELYATQANLTELVLQFKTSEKLQNQELKNLRKKVIYLLRRSIEMNYETADEEDAVDERVIQF